MNLSNSSNKTISLFTLVMINVIAVDNLRSLTVGVEFGFALIFFYFLAAIFFFVPCILVAAELATAWPNTGGVYVWVREAFGKRVGLMAIWLQWIYNVVWYPTIFSFIAGMFAYLIHPDWVNVKIYMFAMIVSLFWMITLLNCLGLRASTLLSTVGAIIGTMLPMALIITLGFIWYLKGYPRQIEFSLKEFFPNLTHLDNLAFLTNILFGLMGIEMSAVHAGDVKSPARNYPRALLYSSIIIFFTLVLSSLAIAIVIPKQELNLVSGFIDAFAIFFKAYHMEFFIPILAALIIIGSLGGASTWVVGSARGLMIAAEESKLPFWMSYKNAKGMPVGNLIAQAVLVTLLSLLFLIMPTVNAFYWVLSNLTAQLALIFYFLYFISAIRLRYKHANVFRAFRIPLGKVGMIIVAGMGIFACVSAFFLGFIPPAQLDVGKIIIYESILVIGILIFCLPILFIKNKCNSSSHG